MICPQDEQDGTAEFETLEGVEVHRYHPRFAGEKTSGYLREYAHAFLCTWRLARRLASQRPFDVVHACNPPDFLLFAAWPARRPKARLIFDHHDVTPELFLTRFGNRHRVLYWATRLLERLSFHAADVVLASNESYAEIARTRGHKRSEDVFVVRNAPNLERLRPVNPDPQLKGGKPLLIAYLGVMAPQDGVDYALRALALLRERRRDWQAVFGGEGPARTGLMAMAEELGLTENVDFVGWLGDDQIARLLSTADVCLSPEPKTPLNDVSTMVKVAEYLAISKPVVAFSLGETRKVAGDAAAYAQPNDVSEYAARISELLDDPAKRQAMGAAGRERVAASMTWEHSTVELRAAYRHALGGRASGRLAPSPRASRRAAPRMGGD